MTEEAKIIIYEISYDADGVEINFASEKLEVIQGLIQLFEEGLRIKRIKHDNT